MRAKWKPEEVDLLRQLAGKEPIETIATKLKKTPCSVIHKLKHDKIPYTRDLHAIKWKPEEVEFLHQWATKLSCKEIAQRLNKTPLAVRTQLQRKHIPHISERWTKEELSFLWWWAGKMPITSMAQKLGKTITAILSKLHREGITYTQGTYSSQEVLTYLGEYARTGNKNKTEKRLGWLRLLRIKNILGQQWIKTDDTRPTSQFMITEEQLEEMEEYLKKTQSNSQS